MKHRCPRCRSGRMFSTGAFSFRRPFEMRTACDKCGLNFYPEPGFYYGAMFMSYILTSFFSLGVVGFCILVMKWSVEAAFTLLLTVLAVLFVWFFRTARSVWLAMTVRYDKMAAEKYDPEEAPPVPPSYVNRNF